MLSRTFLCQFDAFAKPLSDFRIQTISGAFVSILSGLAIIFLFVSELISYVTPQLKQEIVVDISRGQKISIRLDILYLYVPCPVLNLDTMDTTGEQQIDVVHEIFKIPVDSAGNLLSASKKGTDGSVEQSSVSSSCGSCYGAETESRNCCNTCKEVQMAYHERRWVVSNISVFEQCRDENWTENIAKLGAEGCRIHGVLHVNKVAGSFHIAPGNSFASDHVHVHTMQGLIGTKMNMTHRIGTLSFGSTYPGQRNPLDGFTMHVIEPFQMITYYLKLVPTIYSQRNVTTNTLSHVESNQYSVTWHSKGTPVMDDGQGIPGIFFNYEIAPLLVKISQEEKSLMHFLTNTCAIVGGVFTVASLVDAFIYQSTCMVRKRLSRQ